MKASSGLFAVLLILWSGASTYLYVCKIKKDCDKQTTEVVSENKQNKENLTLTGNDKNQNGKIKKDTVSVINNLKKKLTDGYTLGGFSKNSSVNSNFESDFNEFAENLKIYLEKSPSVKILITGYTDNTGTVEANLLVGKKRAEFLKSKLIEKGIDKKRIETFSKGQTDPVADNKTEEGRKRNRRAVIKIINN